MFPLRMVVGKLIQNHLKHIGTRRGPRLTDMFVILLMPAIDSIAFKKIEYL